MINVIAKAIRKLRIFFEELMATVIVPISKGIPT